MQFDTVEEACKDKVKGDKDASVEAVDIYQRISCYRRFTGQPQAKMNRRITEAVQAHATYLELNGLDENWQFEDGGQGFTGADAFERLSRAEYFSADVDTTSAFVWEVLLGVDPTLPRGQLIDEYMHDPFIRDVFLAPAWEGGGYAEFTDSALGEHAYMNIVLYFPSGARSARPVTYPMDGQTSVPPSWNNVYAGYGVMSSLPAVTGYPVTFTVGSSDYGAGFNPLNLQVRSSTFTGPSGAVEHTVILPGFNEWGNNWSTAILVPNAPLEPGATYTVEAELSWISRTKRVETITFTTASAGAATPVARTAPVLRMLTPRWVESP